MTWGSRFGAATIPAQPCGEVEAEDAMLRDGGAGLDVELQGKLRVEVAVSAVVAAGRLGFHVVVELQLAVDCVPHAEPQPRNRSETAANPLGHRHAGGQEQPREGSETVAKGVSQQQKGGQGSRERALETSADPLGDVC